MIYFIKQYWKYFAMALAFASASVLLGYLKVDASTFTTDTNLFEGTYSNNLIDMAISQIDNFYNKNYVIFQNGYNYYLISSDNYSINNNSITMTSTNIISAIRSSSSGYNYYYEYSSSTESSTTINISNIIISNIPFKKSVSSKRFEDYKFNYVIKNIGIFVFGLVFAIFLTKERVYL